jgi:hypothetical protein
LRRAQPPISKAISPVAMVFEVPSVTSRKLVDEIGNSNPSLAPGIVPALAA